MPSDPDIGRSDARALARGDNGPREFRAVRGHRTGLREGVGVELQERPDVLAKRGGIHVREKDLQRDGDARGKSRVVVDLFVSVAHAPEDAGPAAGSDVEILLLEARRFALSFGANLSTLKHWPQMTIGTGACLG